MLITNNVILKSVKAISDNRSNEKISHRFKTEKSSEDKANSEKGYWLEKTRKALGKKQDGKPYTFGHVLGMAGQWSVKKIKSRYHECKKADIPFAPLWHWKRNQDES